MRPQYILIPILLTMWTSISSVAQSTENIDSVHTEVLENVEFQSQNKSRNAASLHQTIINKETLLQTQGNTFINTLEKLPGISAIQTGVGISKPVIRGLSLNRVIVNEYGIKQEGQQWGMDHGLEIDQFNVDKVEIIKGPVSILYGSDGIGGIINILPAPIPYNEKVAGEIISSFKSNNNLWGISGKLNQRVKDFYYLARFSYQNFGVYKVPADSFTYNSYILPIYEGYLKNTAGRELGSSLLIGVEKDWGKSSLYVSNFHQKAGFFPGAFGIPRTYNLQAAENRRIIEMPHQLINHFKIISNNQFFSDWGTFYLDLGYQHNTRKEIARPHAHGGSTPTGTTSLQLTLQTLTANLRHIRQFGKFKLQNGIHSQWQQNQTGGYEFLIPAYKQWQVGIFSYGEYRLTPQTILTGGLRYDYAFQDAATGNLYQKDNNGDVINTENRSIAFTKNYQNISTGWGLDYQWNPLWNLKFNVGTAFRIPIIAELAANGVHHGTFRHEMGSSDLRSEKGLLTDLHLSYNPAKTQITVSPFINYFSNYIYLKPSGRYSTLPEAGQIYQYTGARSLFIGTELSIDYQWNKALTLQGSFEYVWNQNLDIGLGLPFTPPLSILKEITYKPLFLNKNEKTIYSFSVSGQYFAAQNRTDINEPQTPGYYLVNASINARYPIKSNFISIYLQARNLLNEKYMNNMSRYRILNLPEQGLNIQVMIRYEFG